MVYCSNCGSQLRDEAKFCDKCGSSLGKVTSSGTTGNEYNVRTEDVVRSTKILASQQRLYIVLASLLGGVFLLVIAAMAPSMPNMNDPFGPHTDYTFNIIAALMGLGAIILGIAFYVLGERSQDKY